jgi:hypothetical protein
MEKKMEARQRKKKRRVQTRSGKREEEENKTRFTRREVLYG